MLEHKQRHGNRQMLHLVEMYMKEHPEEGNEIDPESVANWALAENKYVPTPISQHKLLRRKISRALRDDYIQDPQGRDIRKYHFVIEGIGTTKRSRAFSIFDAPPEHMRISLSLRRKSALHDVVQLKLDFDSYNDNNNFGETLPPLDFDFNKDVEELNLPTDYPD